MTQLELQSRVRRLEFLLCACAVLAVAPWICFGVLCCSGITLDLPLSITARGLSIVDAQDRSLLTLDSEGQAGRVRMLSKEGRQVAALGGAVMGGVLELNQPNGKPLLWAKSHVGLGGALTMFAKDGKETVYLGVDSVAGGNLTLRSPDGEPMLVARDDNGKGGSLMLQVDEHKGFARLGPDNNGNGQLRLLSSKQQSILFLGAGMRGDGTLEVSTADGRNYAYFLADEKGRGCFGMLSPQDKAAIAMTADARGGESRVYNAQGKEVLYNGWVKGGGAQMKIWHDDGHALIAAGSTGNGGAGFHAFGPDSKTRFYAGSNDRDGSGLLSLFHVAGNQIVGLGVDSEGKEGVLNLRDQTGEMTVRLPGAPR